MLGTARSSVVEAERLRKKELPLMEVFGPTVQGEGAVIGQLTYFIRLGLCDYKCTMCDSMHAVDPLLVSQNAKWITQAEIFEQLTTLRRVHPGSTNWVTLSGGNPLVHDLYHLCRLLRDNQWRIAVETQGTIYNEWLWECDVVTISPKSPGMGERFDPKVFVEFLGHLRTHTGLNVKIVVFNEDDLSFAHGVFQICERMEVGWDQMYLSQGNPFPPHKTPEEIPYTILFLELRDMYLKTLDLIHRDEILSRVKFLPQFHVWLWGNKQGV